MTAPSEKMTTKEALLKLEDGADDSKWGNDPGFEEALAVLAEMAEDYERQKYLHELDHSLADQWQSRSEKAEAEAKDESKRRAAIAESLQAHQDELDALKQDVCSALGAFEHEGPRLAAMRVKAELEKFKAEHDLTVKHMADDYNKLVDELKKVKAEHKKLQKLTQALLGESEIEWEAKVDNYTRLESKNETLKADLQAARQIQMNIERHEIEAKARAEKAEAELARWKPMIEAVEKATLYDTGIPGVTLLEFSNLDEERILHAALKAKENK